MSAPGMMPSTRVARFVRSTELTPAVASLTFDAEGLEWIAGQYVELVDPRSPETRCAFSIASPPTPEHPGRFEIAAARGSSATFLFELTPGAELPMLGPRGKFSFRSAAGVPVTFVGAGTGLAPLRAMLLDALRVQSPGSAVSPRFLVVVGARAQSDLIWSDEFSRLAFDAASVGYVPTLSQPSAEWRGRRGYVQAHLAELLRGRAGGDVYVCGPSAMVTACVDVASKEAGVPPVRIYTEGH